MSKYTNIVCVKDCSVETLLIKAGTAVVTNGKPIDPRITDDRIEARLDRKLFAEGTQAPAASKGDDNTPSADAKPKNGKKSAASKGD